jgi:hypothetical protein
MTCYTVWGDSSGGQIPSPPQLRCVQQIDLGEQHFAETAVATCEVSNAGSDVLQLTDFVTSCSCAGFEVEEGGVSKRASSLAVMPGGKLRLHAKVSVAANPGTPQFVTLGFSTNDPACPQHLVRVVIPKVIGGVCCSPRSVVFGSVNPDELPTCRILVYENGVPDRSLEAVESSSPERFTVRVVPLTDVERNTPDPIVGRAFAAFEVRPMAHRTGSLAGDITLRLGGEHPVSQQIGVSGTMISRVTFTPAFIAPNPGERQTVDVYAREGMAVDEVVVKSCPADVSAEITKSEKGRWLLRVVRNTTPHDTRPANSREILLEVSSRDTREVVKVPVLAHRR